MGRNYKQLSVEVRMMTQKQLEMEVKHYTIYFYCSASTKA